MFVINAAQPDRIIKLPKSSEDIEKTVWRKSAEPEIYYSTKDGIESFLPRLEQNRVITQNHFYDWYMDGGTLWTMKPNTSTNALEIYEDSLGFNAYFSAVNFQEQAQSDMMSWRLILVAKNNVLLQNNSSGQFYIIKRDRNFLVSGNNYFVSKYNNWLLMWTPWELWTYSDGEEPFLLNRSGNEMKDIKPLDQFNTLALAWNNDVTALYPYYFVDRIIQDKPIKSMAVDASNRTIFYSNTSGLWKLNY